MDFNFWNRKKQEPTKKNEPQQPAERVKSSVFNMDFDELPANLLGAYNYGSTGGMKYNSDAFLFLYQTIPQLSSIVNYILDKAADIPIKHVRYSDNGEEIDLGETEILKILQSPNSLDNETKFRQDAIANLIIFGNTPIRIKKYPGFKTPTELINEPANRIFAIPQYSLDLFGNPDGSYDHSVNPLVKYRKQLDIGTLTDIDIEEMIYIRDVNPSKIGRDYYYGMSRIYAATRTIDVLGNIYDSINAILANRGALGFIKRVSKSGELDPMAYQEIVSEFESHFNKKYGVKKGQRPIMATMADLAFERVSMPITEFQPIELTSQEFDMLCSQMYGFPSPLLNSKEASTYNNIKTLERAFYINTLKPILSTIYNGLSDGLGLSDRNEWLIPDMSNIESLRPDEKEKAEAQKLIDESLRERYNNNEITINQKLTGMGLEPMPNGDLKKNEMPQTVVTLAEKIGVGGTQSLQSILADPNMTPQQKKYSLVYLFGLDETQSNNLTNGTNTGAQEVKQ